MKAAAFSTATTAEEALEKRPPFGFSFGSLESPMCVVRAAKLHLNIV